MDTQENDISSEEANKNDILNKNSENGQRYITRIIKIR